MNNAEQLYAFRRSVATLLKAKTLVRTGMLPPVVWARIDCAGMLLEWRKHGKVHSVRMADARAYYTDTSSRVLYVLRPGDVPEGGSAECYYSRGLAVYQ